MRQRTNFPLRDKSSHHNQRKKILLEHLYTALRIEHATIPPYLTALFSIKNPKESNSIPFQLIRSVAMEEMLHMVLVANIINAIQEEARGEELCVFLNLDSENFGIKYPAPLPGIDSNLIVDLKPFSEAAIDTFLAIEKPDEPADSETEKAPTSKGYKSIGQFYAVIKQELEDYCIEFGEKLLFKGDKSRQVGSEYYYNGGGEIIKVTDLKSAKRAIKVIVDEGEGYLDSIFSNDHDQFGEKEDLAHYFKFNQLKHKKFYTIRDNPKESPTGEALTLSFDMSEVHQINPNLNFDEYPEIQEKINITNVLYWDLIRACGEAFNGKPHKLNDAIILMHSFREKSIFLMRLEVGNTTYNATPTFEYRPSEKENDSL